MLTVKNLDISFTTNHKVQNVTKHVTFELCKNEILSIVGESGSGKSVTALAIMGLLSQSNCAVKGEILFEEKNLLKCTKLEMQKIRGNQIAMIFQEPMSSLNPSLTCGYQVLEIILQHQKVSKKEGKQQVISLFKKVKLPNPERIYKSYPHQISGGQQQRVMIALAIACNPTLLIADEPTTALDATVQSEIITLLKELQQETGMGMLFISHDLALVSKIANKVAVMQHGTLVEQGTTAAVFNNPQHQYTKALIASKPKANIRYKHLPTVKQFINNTATFDVYTKAERAAFHNKIYSKPPLLEIQNLKTYFKTKPLFWFQKPTVTKAVNGISFKIYEGETMGLVGESGCGKTTLGRTILQLEKATSGKILYKGTNILELQKKQLKAFKKEVQIIFQDPYSSLNPKITIGNAIVEPMKVHHILNSNLERKKYVMALLKSVGLKESHFNKYPHAFSGGQRQRIGIARAIALKPKLIVCDESVSALDVSVQAQILNLLNELKEIHNFTYLFISHDLLVVKYMADQLMVMNRGKIEEIGDADTIYENPKSAYTAKLIEAGS